MTTPNGGAIWASDINAERGLPANTAISFADADFVIFSGQFVTGSPRWLSDCWNIDFLVCTPQIFPAGFPETGAYGYIQDYLGQSYGGVNTNLYRGNQFFSIRRNADDSRFQLTSANWGGGLPPPQRISSWYQPPFGGPVYSQGWYSHVLGGNTAVYGNWSGPGYSGGFFQATGINGTNRMAIKGG